MKNLTINKLRVLSALINGEKYGLEIIENIKVTSDATLYIGTLYNLLSSLERDGYVTSRWGESNSDRGGNRRRYYEITAVGEEILMITRNSLLKQWGYSLA